MVLRFLHRGRTLALASSVSALAALLASGCGGGGSSPIAPSNAPIVRALSPATGTSFGGTDVTITGEKFVAGSTVSFGGVPGVNVAVENGNTIRATTPPHASGAVDVTVSGSTGSSILAQAFTFAAPGGSNTPPVVRSVSAKGRKPNEPAGFADLAETIDVTAIVEDAETAIEKLTYQWTATAGTVTGSGPVVTWNAPASAVTPTDVTLTLTVVETYRAPDTSGLPVDKENKATGTATVSLHNSAREVGDMAKDFLEAFSYSTIPVDTVMRDFAPTSVCPGAAAERADVTKNRAEREIVARSIGTPVVTINFGGTCPFRSIRGDACTTTEVSWSSTVKVHTTPIDYYGWIEDTKGKDQVTAVFANKRWYLCASDYDAPLPTYRK
jgi:hypothetical protein